MTRSVDHLVIAPILLPLVPGAVMLLLNESRRGLKGGIGIATTLALLAVSLMLLRLADMPPAEPNGSAVMAYQLGNWPAPFGIVLVLDRLSALMLVLTSVLGVASLLYALARWHRAGPRFHTIFQIQLMGLNGAFLTGDLFNLFVFFEVLLAASYGLVLHGDGISRVRAGLAYIAVNLTASFLFLIGVSLAYGVAGTLNMADLAYRIPTLAAEDAALIAAAAAILGTAFLMKAGAWPLNFWLPTTYAAASAPAAAMFAVMSKLGVYVILRLWTLMFGQEAGPLAGFSDWLLVAGMLTIVFGTVGILASQSLPRLAGCSVLISSGTLIAAVGTGSGPVIGSALFYLVSSTLGIAALFLLIEMIERLRDAGADVLAVTMEAFGEGDEDAEIEEVVGVAIPATVALLGGSFIACALLLAGLPPLSGFLGKFAMMAAMLRADGTVQVSTWVLIGLLTISGLATVIAMTRTGITSFWARLDDSVPRVRVIEMAPVVGLLLLSLGLTVGGGPAMRYMEAATQALQNKQDYVTGVLSAPWVEPHPARNAR